jgi:hypothetical protein
VLAEIAAMGFSRRRPESVSTFSQEIELTLSAELYEDLLRRAEAEEFERLCAQVESSSPIRADRRNLLEIIREERERRGLTD